MRWLRAQHSVTVDTATMPLNSAIDKAKRELAEAMLHSLIRQPHTFIVDQLGDTVTVSVNITLLPTEQWVKYQRIVDQAKKVVGLL